MTNEVSFPRSGTKKPRKQEVNRIVLKYFEEILFNISLNNEIKREINLLSDKESR